MDKGAKNDLAAAVPKFCLALEEYRRTQEGRVRTSQEFLATFFVHDEKSCTDKLLKHLPNEVRGPIVAAWGIRGSKAAIRDNDERIQQVVYDALLAGDVDHQAFEEGLTPETLVRWLPLGDLWSFWRGGKLTKQAIHKAVATAYELYLFDARWFLETLTARSGALKGTDVLADGLTKDDLTQWVRRIHETGDGSPKGLVGALGWDKIVAKTANEVLVAVLDAVVTKVGLVVPQVKDAPKAADPGPKVETRPEAKVEAKAEPKPEAKADTKPADAKPADAPKIEPEAKAEAKPEPKPEETKIDTKPDGGDTKVEPLRSTDKPPADTSWSTPPAAPDPGLSGDSDINVVIDDDLLSPPPPTAPKMKAASPVEPEPEAPRRSERPAPPRGPSGPRGSR